MLFLAFKNAKVGLGVRAVRYSFLCMTLSFATSRRFIPTLSTHECVRHAYQRG
jgi:hypothetical protein